MLLIQQGDTTHPVKVLVSQSSDHISGLTGLSSATLLAGSKISKSSGAFASAAGSFAEIGNGEYVYTPTSGEVNTLGELTLSITGVASADPLDVVRQVVAFNPYDAAALGLSRMDAAVTSRQPSGNVTVGGYAAGEDPGTLVLATAANKLTTDASGRVTLTTSEHTTIATDTQTGLAAQGYTAARAGYLDTLNGLVAAVWAALTSGLTTVGSVGKLLTDNVNGPITTGSLDLANGVETGLTERQALRLITASVAGKLSGGGTTTITIRNAVADSKPRITATVDGQNDRTAIVWDAS